MGFDFTSESGAEFRLRGGTFWAFYLSLAKVYGWVPRGTLPPPSFQGGAWPGRYDTNDGQMVSKEDAADLAAALERALRDDERYSKEKRVAEELARNITELFKQETGEQLPIEELESELQVDEVTLRDLSRFCAAGSFTIE